MRSSFVVMHLVLAAAALPSAVAADGDLSYHTAEGRQRIARHPSWIAVGLAPSGDLAALSERVEGALSERWPAARVEPRTDRVDLAIHGISMVEVRGAGFEGMARALDLLKADVSTAWAEPVYTIGGAVALYPHDLAAVRLAPTVSHDRAQEIHAALGGRVARVAPHDWRLAWIEPAGDEGSVALANRYDAHHEVLWAEPDFFVRRVPSYTPNDPHFDSEWHLKGGAGYSPDCSVEIEDAWDLAYDYPASIEPASTTVVTVCDTGILVDHEDLRVTGEGYDTTNSGSINPDNMWDGHGTSVSGVAAGWGDNGIGVAGACPSCQLWGIKLDLPGVVADSVLYFAFYEAATFEEGSEGNRMAALNNSWGLDTPWIYIPLTSTMKEAVDLFSTTAREGKGGVVVFASGNSDQLAALDGATGYNRTLTVGASTCQGHLAGYSNYGHVVDVIAPSSGDGCGIRTTSMNGGYTGDFGGTSSAAPLVSGIVALLAEANPEITEAQMREAIILSADHIDAESAAYEDSPFFEDSEVLFSWTHAYGRVNARRAVEIALSYGDSGCTEEYELCNGLDDDCDGTTEDEHDACNPCQLDQESNGREFCDDGIDNDCDGLTDPPDCVDPCEDLSGMCGPCESSAECWPGLDCEPVSLDFDDTYCLKQCLDDSWCPEGYHCETYYFNTCIPEGWSCEGLEPELPDPSCEEQPEDAGPDGGEEDAGADAGGDADADADTDTDASPAAEPSSPSNSGCGCAHAGAPAVAASLLSFLVP